MKTIANANQTTATAINNSLVWDVIWRIVGKVFLNGYRYECRSGNTDNQALYT
jgi:hypothetical protein